MEGLIGEYHHTIDAKGRLSVPAKFRTVLGDQFVLSKGVDRCLTIYSQKEWGEFQDKLKALPTLDPSAREIKRFFGAGSVSVDVDPHGRILVPANLQEYAGLQKDVTIVGTTDGKAEVWDTKAWDEREGRIGPEEAIQNLFDRGIVI